MAAPALAGLNHIGSSDFLQRVTRLVRAHEARSVSTSALLCLDKISHGSVTVTDLALYVGISVPAVSKQVGVLAGTGLVEKCGDEGRAFADRRRRYWRLSARGAEFLYGSETKDCRGATARCDMG